ncbi:hypothetical protein Droror1_Dr00016388 [Drosera rotundifolia]
MVLSPTRELAQQISDVLTDAGKPCGVKVLCLYEGTSKGPQISTLKVGVGVALAARKPSWVLGEEFWFLESCQIVGVEERACCWYYWVLDVHCQGLEAKMVYHVSNFGLFGIHGFNDMGFQGSKLAQAVVIEADLGG